MMRTIKKVLFTLLLGFLFMHGKAQSFIAKGSITYERKIQIHKLLENNSWMKDRLDEIPKFYSSTFQLTFNSDTSYYKKTSEDEPNSGSWAVYARDNEIISYFKRKEFLAKKTIYGDVINIKDSLSSFQWKLVNETRTIAGIPCKKATTIIHDSIFVVAFYAENITVSGGPEQFGGLPGLILGVAIPRLHVSYYAKKVETNEKQTIVIPKQKGKTLTCKEFKEMVFSNMKWAVSSSGIGLLYLFL